MRVEASHQKDAGEARGLEKLELDRRMNIF
jgi:hypothetical protein